MGALATGIFANPAITAGQAGLLYGNPGQLWTQFVSVVATVLYSGLATFIVVLVTRALTGGIRVDEKDEIKGLDGAIHGERGFEIEF